MTDTVVLAFSGGLDTSWCVPWLKETRGAEVVTVTVDVGGFDAEALKRLAERSRVLGASRHIHVDARDAFFDEVLKFLVFGNVMRGQVYPLSVGAERGLQAREVARLAGELGAKAICHGCTAAGNDQVRFDVALRALAPDIEVLAPIRDLAPSRDDETTYLRERGLPLPESGGRYSVNTGLWGVTIGGAETTGTTQSIPEDAWVRTRGAFAAPRPPERHRLTFERGIPVALDGAGGSPVQLIEKIDRLAAAFGIGRAIHLGDTILGFKGRVAFEAPAAALILAAHRELEKLVLTQTQARLKDQVAAVYGDLVHEGRLLDPAARDVEAFLTSSQARVTGGVNLLIRQGSLFVEGIDSPWSLHAASRSVYGEAARDWTPADARGFSRLFAQPIVLHARAGRNVAREAGAGESHS